MAQRTATGGRASAASPSSSCSGIGRARPQCHPGRQVVVAVACTLQQRCSLWHSNGTALSPSAATRPRRLALQPPSAYPFVATTLAPLTHHATSPHQYQRQQQQIPPQPLQPQAVTLTIFYRTGWSTAVLHGSVLGGPWTDFPLQPHPSAPTTWQRCTFQLPPAALSPTTNNGTKLVEFVLTNGQGQWDKPSDGGNYVITQPGTHSISDGYVHHITGKRVLVVSDLDGTMVGDDQATAAFTQWWHDVAIPRGGVLVYNTGRSLDSFLELLRDKAHCLAVPDALISAMGTKIYEHDAAATGQHEWKEDAVWLTQLDWGWDLELAREACYRALAEVGRERMHFRPPEEQGSHKVTCGVRADALRPALDVLEANLASKGVKGNVVTSGTGQWRYVDVVPIRGGKLAALNYVRRRFGFGPHETVACGDSGNDVLMMQGDNPALIVGNAQQDLQDWYHSRLSVEPRGNGPEGKQRLVMARRHEALGVLEGLQQWGFK